MIGNISRNIRDVRNIISGYKFTSFNVKSSGIFSMSGFSTQKYVDFVFDNVVIM